MHDYADVAVPVALRRTFAYSIPQAMKTRVSIGSRVLVPFGRKLLTGVLVGFHEIPPPGIKLKPIRDLLDGQPLIPHSLVETAMWAASYYFTAPGELLKSLFPAGAQPSGEEMLRLNAEVQRLLSGGLRPTGLSAREDALLEALHREGPLSLAQLRDLPGLKDAPASVPSLQARGLIDLEERRVAARVDVKQRLGIQALPEPAGQILKLTERQQSLLHLLRQSHEAEPLADLLGRAGLRIGVARSLESKGLVSIHPIPVQRVPIDLGGSPARKEVTLTGAQAAVFECLREMMWKRSPRKCLLHGVTGSGKTEIYLRLIAEVLALRGTALFLVPEIGLTPLLSRIAVSHFPDKVALLHSGMSSGERFDQWNRIREGRAPVVVGTRSAVFAPVENLRLIVIDEEQDHSYKQDETPCYHAREVAWHRVRQSGGILLMGSATPSIETFYAAQEGKDISYFSLNERVEARPLASVTIADMSLEFQRHGKAAVLAGAMIEELQTRMERKEQSIVLLNRRGYSRSLLCRSCGHSAQCTDCSISLTYHQDRNRLICHYCGEEQSVPSACTNCGGEYIYFVGVGTEQLEDILKKRFPAARLARLDRDSTRRRGSLRKTLIDFSEGKLDILVGTQMLAKGHDFPNVTFVGVVAADAGLQFPDFRSAERVFQLLTQVAGRAGRGSTPGKVIIQSYYPDHYALRFSKKQDYAGFYAQEVEFRRLLGYPPFTSLVQILISEPDLTKALGKGQRIAQSLKNVAESLPSIRILGPASAPMERLKGKYRIQVLIKSASRENALSALELAFKELSARRTPLKNVRVDLDPLSLL